MRLYLKSGQRALAARQYGICRLTLAKELGVLPMEETQTLYAQIFPETDKSRLSVSVQEPLNLEQALGQLHQISQTIELTWEQVQQTLRYLTKYTDPNK
jgi:DNA-binding SARP family transcriptional activator